ncbi:MAG: exodeoxyribonuclease III [Syntrophotaleaceae bacterium]
MKIVSFNVNGIRARLHQLLELVARHQPDIIGLQETKVPDADFPLAALQELGYRVEYYGQKSHYGVALMSRTEPLEVQKGFPDDGDGEQRRLIAAAYGLAAGGKLWVVNGYFPQGESRSHPQKFPAKELFYAKLYDYLQRCFKPDDRLVVLGDFNVAPEDLDVGIGADSARRWLRSGKCSFLPEERQWFICYATGACRYLPLVRILPIRRSVQLVRLSQPIRAHLKRACVSIALASHALAGRCTGAGIDYRIRAMERPSDHCLGGPSLIWQ